MSSGLLAVACFVSMTLILLSLSGAFQRPRRAVESRVNRFLSAAEAAEPVSIERRGVISAMPFFNRLLSRSQQIFRLQAWIRQAGFQFSPGVFLLFSATLGLACFLLTQISGTALMPSILLTGMTTWLPTGVLNFLRSRRQLAFSRQFPDAIGRMVSSLRSGYSLQMALEAVSENRDTLAAQEFGEVRAELDLGQSFEQALEKMLDRMDTAELRLFVSAVKIQRESGGNLADLLDNLEGTIRERFELQNELRSATGQARLSGIILSLLPVFVATVLFFVNRDYILFFVRDPAGRALLWASVLSQLAGIWMIRKIISIKV